MANKKYYWLKLKENFFESDEVKIIENMPNGKDYIIYYMKLLLKSIRQEGYLMFRDIIPYTPEMLASITNTDIDTVRVATDLFVKLNLIEKLDNGALFMVETQKMIGKETEWAEKKRIQRAKKDNVLALSSECPTDIDKELDKDKDIYNEIFNHWNSKRIIVHQKLTSDMKKKIIHALKVYSLEDIKAGIDRYTIMYSDKECTFCNYKWSLGVFLKQGNALPEFLDEGSKWESYKDFKKQQQNKTRSGSSVPI